MAAPMAKSKPSKPPPNVFLSWSGDRSRQVALDFRKWLKPVLQVAEPWMSDVDIDKGSVSIRVIGQALETCKVGVVFLAPDNLQAPWINFEAGAVAKTVREDARLFTFLLDGLRPSDVIGPLQQFQHTLPAVKDVKKLVLDMAQPLEADLTGDALGDAFDGQWSRFESTLRNSPASAAKVPHRTDRELLEEILGLVRAAAQARVTPWEMFTREYKGRHSTVAERSSPTDEEVLQRTLESFQNVARTLQQRVREKHPAGGQVIENVPDEAEEDDRDS